MSVYLVAGGAGFIGTNFVSYLRSRHPGDKVVVIDYTCPANRDSSSPS